MIESAGRPPAPPADDIQSDVPNNVGLRFTLWQLFIAVGCAGIALSCARFVFHAGTVESDALDRLFMCLPGGIATGIAIGTLAGKRLQWSVIACNTWVILLVHYIR